MFRSHVAVALAVGLLVFTGTALARHLGLFQAFELHAYDAYMRHRAPASGHDVPVVLVVVSEADIQKLGRWPLSDLTLAEAIEKLVGFGPRAVGLDIFRDIPVPPGRVRLNSVLAAHDEVVVVYRFNADAEAGVSAPASLRGSAQAGFNDILVDPGGVVRRGLLFLSATRARANGTVERVTDYSFALRLALEYLEADGVRPVPDPDEPEQLRLGPSTIAPLESGSGGYQDIDARGYQFLLDYRGGPGVFPRYPITSLLSNELDPGAIKGKVVLIGTTAISVPDLFSTPLSQSRHADEQIPGVELHAHAVSQLIRLGLGQSQTSGFAYRAAEVTWILLWSLAGALAGAWIGSARRSILVATSGVGVLVLVTFAAFLRNWWVPVVPPAAAWLASAAVMTAYELSIVASQRRSLMTLFSRHVDPQLARSIWDQRERFIEGGRPSSCELTATVMFTDLHGFTATAEKLSPGDLMDWLNEYMEAMTPLVMAHGGVILRFVGDAIMAAFGAPIARASEADIDRDARNAVHCGLSMQRRLIELNRSLDARGLPMIGMRIGMLTGKMVGGSLGNRDRLEYNLHGDSVNTAARLESYDKQSFQPDFLRKPCRILIGGPTLARLGDGFVTNPIGEAALKGKNRTVAIHEVLDVCAGNPARE